MKSWMEFGRPDLNFGVLSGEQPALCMTISFPWGRTLLSLAKACRGLFCHFLVSSALFLSGDDTWCLSKAWAMQSWKNRKDSLKHDPEFKLWLKMCRMFKKTHSESVEHFQTLTFQSFSDSFVSLSLLLRTAFPSPLPLVNLMCMTGAEKHGSVNVNNRLNPVWLWRLSPLFYSFILSVHVLVLQGMKHNQV